MSDHILLVEGESDRGFFEVLCRKLGLGAKVQVAPPRRFGAPRDSKQTVFNVLPTMLRNLGDSEDGRLAVIVDADREKDGGGFSCTVEQFIAKVEGYGYEYQRADSVESAGLLFSHNDGLNDLGLWVMPNNGDEGALENWLLQCAHPEEQTRLNHAQSVIDSLPFDRRFNELRRPKAEVATWLAWQKRPGEGLYNALEADLVDENSPQYKALVDWLKRVFRE